MDSSDGPDTPLFRLVFFRSDLWSGLRGAPGGPEGDAPAVRCPLPRLRPQPSPSPPQGSALMPNLDQPFTPQNSGGPTDHRFLEPSHHYHHQRRVD